MVSNKALQVKFRFCHISAPERQHFYPHPHNKGGFIEGKDTIFNVSIVFIT